jgi:hypothetical protein
MRKNDEDQHLKIAGFCVIMFIRGPEGKGASKRWHLGV